MQVKLLVKAKQDAEAAVMRVSIAKWDLFGELDGHNAAVNSVVEGIRATCHDTCAGGCPVARLCRLLVAGLAAIPPTAELPVLEKLPAGLRSVAEATAIDDEALRMASTAPHAAPVVANGGCGDAGSGPAQVAGGVTELANARMEAQ